VTSTETVGHIISYDLGSENRKDLLGFKAIYKTITVTVDDKEHVVTELCDWQPLEETQAEKQTRLWLREIVGETRRNVTNMFARLGLKASDSFILSKLPADTIRNMIEQAQAKYDAVNLELERHDFNKIELKADVYELTQTSIKIFRSQAEAKLDNQTAAALAQIAGTLSKLRDLAKKDAAKSRRSYKRRLNELTREERLAKELGVRLPEKWKVLKAMTKRALETCEEAK
jgi:hypothetical protein